MVCQLLVSRCPSGLGRMCGQDTLIYILGNLYRWERNEGVEIAQDAKATAA